MKNEVLFTALLFLFFMPCAINSRASEIYTVTYSLNGIYVENENQISGSGIINVTYAEFNNTIEGYINNLPYGISNSVLSISGTERDKRMKDGIQLYQETESYPYKIFFGVPMLTGNFENDDARYKVQWHLYWGFMLYMEIEKKNELSRKLYIRYEDSEKNLYEGLSNEQIKQIEGYKFLFSPAGLIITATPFIVSFVIFAYIVSQKKKLSRYKLSRVK